MGSGALKEVHGGEVVVRGRVEESGGGELCCEEGGGGVENSCCVGSGGGCGVVGVDELV